MRTIFITLAALGFASLTFAVDGRADSGQYPDWSGQWQRPQGRASFDPSKPGNAQQIPYTPEIQAYFDKVEANRAEGGLKDNFSTSCVPLGMPRVMINYEIMDLMITPDVTYMWFTESNELRRIYTDGRAWPKKLEPSYLGYSIGEWRDEGHTGKFDTLIAETRGFRGPRVFDSSGTPLDRDDQSVFKERFDVDKADPMRIHHQITTTDHALTRPYVVDRVYRRAKKDIWTDTICALDTSYLILGEENYFISADGYIMPAKKGQKPPDLKYFVNSRK